jgi:hypothetical protein
MMRRVSTAVLTDTQWLMVDDHIHKLLELVSQSSVDEAVEPAADADADAEVAAAPQTTNGQDETPVGASTAQDESKSIANGNGSGHEEEGSAPVHPSKQSGGGLVFLQDDELDSGRTERDTEAGQEDGQGHAQAEGDGEGDGFEMVEQPAAHEVSLPVPIFGTKGVMTQLRIRLTL